MEEEDVIQNSSVPSTMLPVKSETNDSKKSNKWLFIIIGVIFVLILFFGAWFLFSFSDENTNSNIESENNNQQEDGLSGLNTQNQVKEEKSTNSQQELEILNIDSYGTTEGPEEQDIFVEQDCFKLSTLKDSLGGRKLVNKNIETLVEESNKSKQIEHIKIELVKSYEDSEREFKLCIHDDDEQCFNTNDWSIIHVNGVDVEIAGEEIKYIEFANKPSVYISSLDPEQKEAPVKVIDNEEVQEIKIEYFEGDFCVAIK